MLYNELRPLRREIERTDRFAILKRVYYYTLLGP
jgi:hypothetical protein